MTASANYEYLVAQIGVLGVPRGCRVLDYGCGAGEVVQIAVRAGYDAHGVDVFYEGGSYRADADRAGLLGGRILEIQNGTIPHSDAQFDVVVTNQVLEHVADLDSVIAEISRVLKPGGLMLALFPSREVWREGHVGVPFLHLIPRESKSREFYALLVRSAGFGFNKGDKSRRQWAKDAVAWVDTYTYYRSWSEIEGVLRRRIGSIERLEPDYLLFRLSQHRVLRRLATLLGSTRAGNLMLRRFVVRYAGLVLLVRKPL